MNGAGNPNYTIKSSRIIGFRPQCTNQIKQSGLFTAWTTSLGSKKKKKLHLCLAFYRVKNAFIKTKHIICCVSNTFCYLPAIVCLKFISFVFVCHKQKYRLTERKITFIFARAGKKWKIRTTEDHKPAS